MKKIIAGLGIAAMALALYVAPVTVLTVGTTGCTTTNSTNDQATIDAAAIILRGAARDGTVAAVQNDPNNRQYFALAATALSTFVTGKDYTPGAFQTALLALNAQQLTNQWVQIGIGTVIDLYQLYYGQYVKNAVDGNAVAVAFLTAIQDGINAGLGNPVTPAAKAHYYSKGRAGGLGAPFTGTAPKGASILPRPIK